VVVNEFGTEKRGRIYTFDVLREEKRGNLKTDIGKTKQPLGVDVVVTDEQILNLERATAQKKKSRLSEKACIPRETR